MCGENEYSKKGMERNAQGGHKQMIKKKKKRPIAMLLKKKNRGSSTSKGEKT